MQPIVGDWRAKVKAAKRAAKKAEKAPRDDPKDRLLAEANQGLPSGWRAIRDATSNKIYYGNMVTKVWQFQALKSLCLLESGSLLLESPTSAVSALHLRFSWLPLRVLEFL